jgi:hypothetical protein
VAEIQGSCDELFAAVPGALAGLLAAGDVGASVAVFADGEPVVDVWGGFADADRTIPWQRDTIVNVKRAPRASPSVTVRGDGHGVICAVRVSRGRSG